MTIDPPTEAAGLLAELRADGVGVTLVAGALLLSGSPAACARAVRRLSPFVEAAAELLRAAQPATFGEPTPNSARGPS